jgi:hypothetical protein
MSRTTFFIPATSSSDSEEKETIAPKARVTQPVALNDEEKMEVFEIISEFRVVVQCL